MPRIRRSRSESPDGHVPKNRGSDTSGEVGEPASVRSELKTNASRLKKKIARAENKDGQADKKASRVRRKIKERRTRSVFASESDTNAPQAFHELSVAGADKEVQDSSGSVLTDASHGPNDRINLTGLSDVANDGANQADSQIDFLDFELMEFPAAPTPRGRKNGETHSMSLRSFKPTRLRKTSERGIEVNDKVPRFRKKPFIVDPQNEEFDTNSFRFKKKEGLFPGGTIGEQVEDRERSFRFKKKKDFPQGDVSGQYAEGDAEPSTFRKASAVFANGLQRNAVFEKSKEFQNVISELKSKVQNARTGGETGEQPCHSSPDFSEFRQDNEEDLSSKRFQNVVAEFKSKLQAPRKPDAMSAEGIDSDSGLPWTEALDIDEGRRLRQLRIGKGRRRSANGEGASFEKFLLRRGSPDSNGLFTGDDDEYSSDDRHFSKVKLRLKKRNTSGEDSAVRNGSTPSGSTDNIPGQNVLTENEKLQLELAENEKVLQALENEVQSLQEKLTVSENRLAIESRRIDVLFQSLDRAQEVRYQNIMEMFTENYNMLGTLESQYENVLSTNYNAAQGRIVKMLWLVVDGVFLVVATVVGSVTRYLPYFRPRTVKVGSGSDETDAGIGSGTNSNTP